MRTRSIPSTLISSLLLVVITVSVVFSADFRDNADQFMENLVNERFEAAVATFAPGLAERHPAEELEEIWYKTIQRYGPYEGYAFGEIIEKDQAISYLYVLKCKSALLAVVLAYNGDGQVMTFVLQPPEGEPVAKQPAWIIPAFIDPPEPTYQTPSYVDTSLFSEVEFTMQGEPPLPATMTVARTNEPNPVVLLFQGFGPTDRDETIGSHKPLRDIAWGLASQGIASIRFDCRAYTQSPDIIAGYDLNDYLLNDLAAMLAYIRMEKEIFDTARIYLAGHGVGGVAAVVAARSYGGVAGVILLATPARPLNELLLELTTSDTTIADSITEEDKKLRAAVIDFLESLQQRRIPDDEMILSAPARVWYDLMDNNHVAIAGQLNTPLLIIHSGRDYGIANKDFEIWEKSSSKNTNISLRKYDDLNHSFQSGPGGGAQSEGKLNTTSVDSRVIDDIAAWIKSK